MEDISFCCTSENSKAMCYSSASSGYDDDGDRVDELRTSIPIQLTINNGKNSVDSYHIEEEDEEDDEEDEVDLSEEALLAQMGYVKSDPGSDNEEEEEDILDDRILVKNEARKHEPINTPTAELNLVSALRGSREKEGRPVEECRVSWGPDVYDPPCTSDDHFAASKNDRHRVEQKGKGTSGRNRQKGSGSEGGSSRKAAGGSKSKKKAEKKHKKQGYKHSDPS
ncbi:uncharacterized protein LOC125193944 [Salvia hispanica]|uniref:uncharacterized protein LOC125193944 n=1 Tax=Salvia hispanica TaxID=49212 RepID=UPI0020097988|nr:uncharacterized protein LOC125193944 [Salvia hispanica]